MPQVATPTPVAPTPAAKAQLPESARRANPRLLRHPVWQQAMQATQQARWADALRHIKKVPSQFGDDPWLCLNLARTYVELEQYADAAVAVRRTLNVCPADDMARDLYVHALCSAEQYDEAVAYVSGHLVGHPQSLRVLTDIAYRQILSGQRGKAIHTLMQALSQQIDYARAHFLMGVAFMASLRQQEALECFETAIVLGAGRDQLAAHGHRTYLARQGLDWTLGETSLQDFVEHVRALDEEESLWSPVFASATLLDDPALQYKAAVACARSIAQSVRPVARAAAKPLGGRPIRVGFLSSDFHEHATVFLMRGLLKHLPTHGIEVFLYSHGADDRSAEREALKADADHFVDLADVPDSAAAERIAADAIDILIDLKGHTSGSRVQVFAYKPAPIQATYLGHPGTTGADYIDYFIGDRIVTPMAHQPYYAEKLVHMPHCYQPNDAERAKPKPMARSAVGLPDNAVVLCAFNQPYKVSPQVYDVWCDILRRNPQTVLWVLDWFDGNLPRYQEEARRRGIDPQRIIGAKKIKYAEHVSRFALADVFIDSWPCNGHTTTSDALWAGVPTVTMMGETFASRVAASLLDAVNLPQYVAHDITQYMATVQRLIDSPAERQQVRDHLERARSTAPLFDTVQYTRDFAELLHRMAAAHIPSVA